MTESLESGESSLAPEKSSGEPPWARSWVGVSVGGGWEATEILPTGEGVDGQLKLLETGCMDF